VTFVPYNIFSEQIKLHPISQIFQKVYEIVHKNYSEILHSIIIFGSFGTGRPKDNSDLDLVLLFKQDINNREVKKEVMGHFKSLSEKKLVTLFSYSLKTFEKLYRWDNSLAHGAMAGKLIYCSEDTKKFLKWCEILQKEIPLNVRRY